MSTFYDTKSKVIKCCDAIFRREDFLFAYVDENSIVIRIKSQGQLGPKVENYSPVEELYATCEDKEHAEEEFYGLCMRLG